MTAVRSMQYSVRMNRTNPTIPNTLPADPVLRCIEIIGGPGFGSIAETGRALGGISRATVHGWKRKLPADRALSVREAAIRRAVERGIPLSEVPTLEELLGRSV